MREIKFRGKHKELGHWVYGDLIHGRDGKVYIDTSQNEVIPETVGQYTGLKDENGQEIYEGNRVRAVYDNPFEYQLEHPEDEGVEIIGNIYENPELVTD
ncbi:YopX family protein [Iocasia frigidifontis]|nr:YopX family protein [Iocasia fonsfrigidae]